MNWQLQFPILASYQLKTKFAQRGEANNTLPSDVTFGGASVLGSHADGIVKVNEPTAVRIQELAAPATTGWLWVVASLALTILAGGLLLRQRR